MSNRVEAQCNLMAFSRRELGIARRSCGVGEDYAGLISPDGIRKLCNDDIRRGAPGIMTELTVNNPEDNIRAFLEAMRVHAPERKAPEPEPLLPKD